VAEDIYVIENANPTIPELISYGGNLTVVLTDEGVVLIDARTDRMHEFVVEQARSLSALPITHVVLTHHHADHSGGTARLRELGATIVISAANDERLNLQSGGDSLATTFSDTLRLTVGNKELHLHEIQGHTQGDTFVYLPQSGVLVAGDLVTTTDSIPVIVNYDDGGSWAALGAALDSIAEFDFEYLVSGHGPVITKDEFLAFRDKVHGIIMRVRMLARQETSANAIADALLTEFGWGGGLATGNIPGMMTELR
jgi:glyoxylase-like metal-dependent hydrolase (beta-lactamase superfamily II)